MNNLDVANNAGQAADLLRALSNPGRLTILCLLAAGEKSVGELEAGVGLSQSALSQHLAVLRRKGLVKTRKVRQNVYYTLADNRAMRVIDTLAEMFCPAAEAPANPAAEVTLPRE